MLYLYIHTYTFIKSGHLGSRLFCLLGHMPYVRITKKIATIIYLEVVQKFHVIRP